MNTKQKYIIIGLTLFVFIIVYLIYENRWIKEGINKEISLDWQNIIKDEKKILDKEVTKDLTKDLNKECKYIIEWKDSDYINTLNQDLVFKYKQWKELLSNDSKNTYNEFKNLKNWYCDKISQKNKQFCIDYRNKDLEWGSTKFEKIFLQSIITWKNLCSSLTENKEDCDSNIEHINNMDKEISKTDILSMDEFDMSKAVTLMWTWVFLDSLNTDFMDKCIKLWKE